MLDLNDLRVFERVGSLRSFSAAARALSQPRSTVSRSVARLEAELGTRLIQRTTRDVALTPSGESLMARCAAALGQLGEALAYVGSHAMEPRGPLRVSAGIGFGINVLAEQLPEFLRRYPDVDVLLDLTSKAADLINDRIDVAIRLGPLPNSSLVAVKLGDMTRVLCAAPAYLERRGTSQTVAELAAHDVIEMPQPDGRPRVWSFTKDGQTSKISVEPRVCANDALTINRLVINGAGVGIISCYLRRLA
jgi:DNA-binding transcriptional LysR family regulator